MADDIRTIIKGILSDLRVELGDEYDKNFERQAFFTEAWQRRKSPVRGNGHILVDTGSLRRSIKSRSDDDSITFYSDEPHAAIHNEGGEIRVTERMKRYFWARYKEATGGFGRKKNGGMRNNAQNRRLSTEAEFWKLMALMKVGSTVKIPRRRFLGASPEVEKMCRTIIEDNLKEYFSDYLSKKLK